MGYEEDHVTYQDYLDYFTTNEETDPWTEAQLKAIDKFSTTDFKYSAYKMMTKGEFEEVAKKYYAQPGLKIEVIG